MRFNNLTLKVNKKQLKVASLRLKKNILIASKTRKVALAKATDL